MKVRFTLFTMIAAALLCASGVAHAQGKLKISFIDVEGGQSTLFVTPAGQSLLIDTGWPGHDGRDADRIAAAAKQAGIAKIDYVLLTHYHEDHAGGIPQLVARIPVGTFIDHGPNRELDHGITERDYAEYEKVLATGASKHLVLKPGDVLPIQGIKATVISSNGELVSHSQAGGGQPNESCGTPPIKFDYQIENTLSLGIEIDFGKLRILDLGDLTQDKERLLMCPVNKLGHIDIYIVSHHGWDQSSSPVLVHAIHPRVAIMDNGERKGGSPVTFDTLKTSPGLEALYQLHYSAESAAKNMASDMIANLQGTDPGNSIELVGSSDGSFTVTNTRTKETRQFAATGSARR